jgi:hypothetical protein
MNSYASSDAMMTTACGESAQRSKPPALRTGGFDGVSYLGKVLSVTLIEPYQPVEPADVAENPC